MRWQSFARRIRMLARRRDAEHELSEELDFHLAMQADKHVAAGLDAPAAEHRARLEFGNVELVKEDARDARGTRAIDETLGDVRYAWRAIRRAPLFALAVVTTIGIAVGLNAAAFTVFDAYVLRPLDVRDPSSLYIAAWVDRTGSVRNIAWTDYASLRRASAAVADLAALRSIAMRVRGGSATGDAVSASYFRLLGVMPALGSMLGGADGPTPDASATVVLSHALWQSRFGGDSSVVGQHLLLRGRAFRIVGVARAGFEGLFKKPRDFWIPLGALALLADSGASPALDGLSLVARLAPGESQREAAAAIGSAMRSLTVSRGASDRAERVMLLPHSSAIAPSVGAYAAYAPIALTFGLVLLLACANVANMLLARGLSRQRELGVRLALGATRVRLVRQLLVESVMLGAPAIVLGFGVAWVIIVAGVRTLFATLPPDLVAFVRLVPLVPDARVFAYGAVAALASAVAFGLTPALQSTRLSVVQATRGEFARLASPARVQGMLIVLQVAVATLLLTSGSALLRQTTRMTGVETGLRVRDVVSVESDRRWRAGVLRRLTASPAVAAIAGASVPVLDANLPLVDVARVGDTLEVPTQYNRVTASYLDLVGVPIVAGRGLASSDELGGSAVVVSEAAARRLWPRGGAVGQTLELRPRAPASARDSLDRFRQARVVGVARDVVTPGGASDPAVMYLPASLQSVDCCLLVRARGDATQAQRSITADLDAFVPGAVERIDRLDTFVAGAIYPYRAAYWIALVLGSIALALTVAGVHGVISYIVAQRSREMGIRLALGATARDVLEVVLGRTARQALVGVAIGAALAMGAGRAIASQIQQMPALDLVAVLAAVVVVFMACIAAAAGPSSRATRTDPNVALRHE
jgi:predicted permease